MATPLDENRLRDALSELTCWDGHLETGIHCQRQLPTFRDAIRLVDAVAEVAEEMDHHPDIDIRYNTVTFTLRTHSVNAVTELDVELARRIEQLSSAAQA
ncbi:MAG TPA: 4a-hydroxytetrahydrobiopterin dehydratase [Mycobacteriales bacterium]|nr:4a-hydroxytetrahydrobiopterin dehydratase [Mycobacteriales bacterium]